MGVFPQPDPRGSISTVREPLPAERVPRISKDFPQIVPSVPWLNSPPARPVRRCVSVPVLDCCCCISMTSPTSNLDLETIRENSFHRELSVSPDPVAAHTDVNDFVSQVPQRRSTHPTMPLSSQLKSSTGDLKSSKPLHHAPARPISTAGRLLHTHTRARKPRSLHGFRRTRSHDSEGPGPNTPFVRRSTVNTDASAPFEETEVWDHKAILSMGMNPYPSQLGPETIERIQTV